MFMLFICSHSKLTRQPGRHLGGLTLRVSLSSQQPETDLGFALYFLFLFYKPV